MEIESHGGWQRCARLEKCGVRLWISLDVGPRVLHASLDDGPNLLAEVAEQRGMTGGSEWRLYGGHRLWIAPEDPVLTYQPDNEPVAHEWDGSALLLWQAPEPLTGLRKELRVELVEEGAVSLLHRIVNESDRTHLLAPWALTCMAPGGRCLIPNEPALSHEEALLPARSMALWSYTDLGDPRFRFRAGFMELRQDPAATTPQKIGMMNRQGWAAYLLGRQLFIKRFPYLPDGVYPDFGCNCEFFTNAAMLEMESLGPLVELRPGETVEHPEHWEFRAVSVEIEEEDVARLPEILGLAAG